MSSVLVSVILPARNAAGTIRRAVDFVLAQQPPLPEGALEIVACDDGSNDETAALLESFGEPVRVLRHETSRGPGAARTTAMGAARGDFLAFLDADDAWLPGALETLLTVFRADPKLVLAGGGAEYVDPAGSSLGVRLPRPLGTTRSGGPWPALLLANPFKTSATMVRAATVREHGLIFREDLPLAEDWEFFLRVAARGGVASVRLLPEVLARYTVSPGGAHGRLTPDRAAAVYRTLFAGLERDPALGPILARHRRLVAANLHLLAACEAAHAGAGLSPRLAALRAWPVLGQPGRARAMLAALLPGLAEHFRRRRSKARAA